MNRPKHPPNQPWLPMSRRAQARRWARSRTPPLPNPPDLLSLYRLVKAHPSMAFEPPRDPLAEANEAVASLPARTVENRPLSLKNEKAP